MNFRSPHLKDFNSTSLEKTIKEFEKRQYLVSLLGLLILIGGSMIATDLHLQSVATQTTKYVSRLIQMDQLREAGLVLEEALNSNFTTIIFKSNHLGRNFTIPTSHGMNTEKSPWRYFSTVTVEIPILNPLNQNSESIIYEYNRYILVPYATLLWLIIVLISIPQTRLIKKKLFSQFEKDLILEKSKTYENIAEQVRHNLRTPLASLMRLPARMTGNKRQDSELLTTAIDQIRKITAALDIKQINEFADISESTAIYDSLYKAINQISETLPSQIKFHYQISDSLCSAKVNHIPVEFQIILANLVNNSLDALHNNEGIISIVAKDLDPYLSIEIQDNGPGIDPKILNFIFNNGFTSGKLNGTGLGLFHAKQWMTQWGGSIQVESQPYIKTVFKISLPITERANWYAPRLKIKATDTVYVLDDQLTGRQLWQFKLMEKGFNNIQLLSSVAEAKAVITESQLDLVSSIFLFDFDLHEKETGIDLLTLLPRDAHRYLTTGHFDKNEIQLACENHGIQLIPKPEIPELPLVII